MIYILYFLVGLGIGALTRHYGKRYNWTFARMMVVAFVAAELICTAVYLVAQ